MKRLIGFFGSILGLLVVIIVTVFAIATIKPRISSLGLHFDAQQAYPPAENPTQSEVPKIEVDTPYPPPVEPVASPIPKELNLHTPTPTSKSTSIPTQTLVPLPTQEVPLPSGLKLVYGETDGENGITRIWLVNITNFLNERKLLATINHKAGYEVRGNVSPDGNKIAYIVVPPGISEKSARTDGSELWVMNSDGSGSHMIMDKIGYLGMWAPDSKSITVGRWMPIENNGSTTSGWRKEIYLVKTDDLERKLLVTDDKSSDFQPVGWSSDGQVFYYVVKTTLSTSWELWAVDVSTGMIYLQLSPPFKTNDIPVLSPDGNWLLFSVTKDEQRTLVVLSIDGQQQNNIAQSATNSGTSGQLTGLWSTNSQSILLYVPSETDQQPNFELVSLNGVEKQNFPITASFLTKDDYLSLIEWSPYEDWAIVREYPTQPQSNLFVIKIDDGKTMQLPLSMNSNWLIPFGWLNQ